jgi:LysR family pca operon transcriptional activator
MFTLRQLQQFVAVVEAQSFRRAADRLHLSQPALSVAVRELESIVGAALLDRARDAVAPTPQGEILYLHACALLREATSAVASVRELRGYAQRELRIGVGPTICPTRVARSLDAVVQQEPGLTFKIVTEVYARLEPRLRAGELDLVIAKRPGRAVDPDIDLHSLGTDQNAVICRPGHPLGVARRVRLARLLEYPWVYSESIERIIPTWGVPFGAQGLSAPQPRWLVDSYPLVVSLLLSSNALSVMPAQYVAADLASRRIARVLVGETPWSYEIVCATRRDRTPAPSALVLRRALQQCFATDVAKGAGSLR